MGVDVTARVFYGIPLGRDFQFPETWNEDDGVAEGWIPAYLASIGITEKDNEKEYWEKSTELAIKGVTGIGWGCAEGCEKYYVRISDAGVSSYWGDIEEIDFIVKPEWNEQLKDFCEKVGLEYKQPKWYLTCKMW